MAASKGRKRGGRTPNAIKSAAVKITTTRTVIAQLQRLTDTELFGKTYTETAERLLLEKLREVLMGGVSRLERRRK